MITYWYLKCGLAQFNQYSDSLRVGPSGDQIPVKARFSVPVQKDPEIHPAFCKMGTGCFSRGKAAGVGSCPPSHVAPKLKKENISKSSPPLGLHACSKVNFTRFMEFAFTLYVLPIQALNPNFPIQIKTPHFQVSYFRTFIRNYPSVV